MTTIPNHGDLSVRGAQNVYNNGSWRALREILAKPYDRINNTDGIINLGLAESCLMHDELVQHFKSSFDVVPSSHYTYGSGPNGSPRLRAALASFFNTRFDPQTPVQSEDIIVAAGVSSVIDSVTYCLCDENDAILVPVPFYSNFHVDITMRSRGKLVPVSLVDESRPYSTTDVFDTKTNEQGLKKVIENCRNQGINVRALLITNPHNPLGKCYPVEALGAFAKFCGDNKLHLISDEIYAQSTFTNPEFPDAETFHSVMSIDTHKFLSPNHVHVMYGMSKDFCANGMRLGLLHSRNAELIEAISSISLFSWPAYLTQDLWARVLEDEKFLNFFIAENQKRLAQSHAQFASFLDELKIPFIRDSNAAFYLWVHLARPELNPHYTIPELKNLIFKTCLEQGVYIRDGKDYYSEEKEDGWFRITFTVDNHTLEVSKERLRKALEIVKNLKPTDSRIV